MSTITEGLPGPPFLILHGGELVPTALAFWSHLGGRSGVRVADASELSALLAATRPAGGVLVAEAAVIAAWMRACPDGPSPWLVVDQPNVADLNAAVQAAPAGILACSPARVLVEGLQLARPGEATWPALLARWRQVDRTAPPGIHGAWIAACIAVGDAWPAGQDLLVPILAEHLAQRELQDLLHDVRGPRPLDLAPVLGAVATRWAVTAAMNGVQLVQGPCSGSLRASPGPLLHGLDAVMGLLCESLPAGARLILAGDAAGIRLQRVPPAGTAADRLDPAALAPIVEAARLAGVAIRHEDQPWCSLTLTGGLPASGGPRPVPDPAAPHAHEPPSRAPARRVSAELVVMALIVSGLGLAALWLALGGPQAQPAVSRGAALRPMLA